MKDRTAGYITEQTEFAVQPTYLVRFFSVKTHGDVTDYPFSRDFSSRTVNVAVVPKLLLVNGMDGGPAQVYPDEGRADIGGFKIVFTDFEGEILKYLSAPTSLILDEAITESTTEILIVGSVEGLPEVGTIIIGTGENAERAKYSSKDNMTNVITISERGADDTTPQSHSEGAVVTNGEEIRPGTRAQVFLGYADLPESDFMSFAKMEVFERKMTSDMAGFEVEIQDIQRSTVKEIFLNASSDSPLSLSGNPITIALQILLSTGTGTNSSYDVLGAENGLAVPQSFVDITGIEALRTAFFSSITMSFSITGRESGLSFLENEIYKPLNIYPVVNQLGQLTFRHHRLSGSASVASLTDADFTIVGWSFGDRMTINHIIFEFAFSDGEYQTRTEFEQTDSIEKYGRKDPKIISSKGLQTGSATTTFIRDRADEISERYSDPPPLLEIETHFRNHHIEPGDLVDISSVFLPNISSGVRGILNEQFELINQSINWINGKIRMTLLDVDAISPVTPVQLQRTIFAETIGVSEITPSGAEGVDVVDLTQTTQTGSLSLQGYEPSILEVALIIPAGTLVLQGLIPGSSQFASPVGSLALQGLAPILVLTQTPSVAALTLQGFTPGVGARPPEGTMSIQGYAPSIV